MGCFVTPGMFSSLSLENHLHILIFCFLKHTVYETFCSALMLRWVVRNVQTFTWFCIYLYVQSDIVRAAHYF